MARDLKYGEVTTEHGSFGEDEPVVVFRAQDRLLSPLLEVYHTLCKLAGSPTHHLELIDQTIHQVEVWQGENEPRTPTSDSWRWRRDWLGEGRS